MLTVYKQPYKKQILRPVKILYFCLGWIEILMTPLLLILTCKQEKKAPVKTCLSSVDSDYCEKTKILYPTQTHFPEVQLDVPVKLVILGSKQVGKSALALRYLTKNQCDTSKNSGKFTFLYKGEYN